MSRGEEYLPQERGYFYQIKLTHRENRCLEKRRCGGLYHKGEAAPVNKTLGSYGCEGIRTRQPYLSSEKASFYDKAFYISTLMMYSLCYRQKYLWCPFQNRVKQGFARHLVTVETFLKVTFPD
jgi:hypothetical protein